MNSPVRSLPPARIPSVMEKTTPATNGTLLRSTSPPPAQALSPSPRPLPSANGSPAEQPSPAPVVPKQATRDQGAAGVKLDREEGKENGAGAPVQAMWADDAAHRRLTEVGDMMLDVAEACLEHAWLQGLGRFNTPLCLSPQKDRDGE